MKISALPDCSIVLTEVYSGVLFVSKDKEEFGLCMRDSGFEFQYAGVWYEAKAGALKRLAATEPAAVELPKCDHCGASCGTDCDGRSHYTPDVKP